MYKCGSFLTFSKIFIENMAEAEIIMNILQSLKREARFFHCKRAKSSNFNEEFQSIPFFCKNFHCKRRNKDVHNELVVRMKAFLLVVDFFQVINGKFRCHRVEHPIISAHCVHRGLSIDSGTRFPGVEVPIAIEISHPIQNISRIDIAFCVY